MKTKIALILMFICLAGCQPKSEIDKCVEANIVEMCTNVFKTSVHPENEIMFLDTKEQCGSVMRKKFGGSLREKCLRAQAGKE